MIELVAEMKKINGRLVIQVKKPNMPRAGFQPVLKARGHFSEKDGSLQTVNCLCCRSARPLVTHPLLYGRNVCLVTGRLHLKLGQAWFLSLEDTHDYIASLKSTNFTQKAA